MRLGQMAENCLENRKRFRQRCPRNTSLSHDGTQWLTETRASLAGGQERQQGGRDETLAGRESRPWVAGGRYALVAQRKSSRPISGRSQVRSLPGACSAVERNMKPSCLRDVPAHFAIARQDIRTRWFHRSFLERTGSSSGSERRSTKPEVEGSSPSQCMECDGRVCWKDVASTRSSTAEPPALNRVVAGSSPAGCMKRRQKDEG